MQDLPVDDLLTIDQAIAILDAHPVAPGHVEVSLDDPALRGTVLATDVFADRDEPPLDRSLMDGYAVTDVAVATLRVVGEVPAGRRWALPLRPGECVAITTGAVVPSGAVAVVPIEHATRDGDTLAVHRLPKPRQAIAAAGSYMRRGDPVLAAGTLVTPQGVALLAAAGRDRVEAYQRPRVGVLTGGDEIVPASHDPRPEQTRNASGPMLRALVAAVGGIAVDAGHAVDTVDALRRRITRAGAACDVLLVTGGMSVGAHDHVPAVLRDLGYAMPVTKLRMKPGKPFVFATRERSGEEAPPPVVFGLPGNPVSAYVCTLLLAARVIRRMAGRAAATPWRTAALDSALPANGPRAFYQPAVVRGDRVTPLDWKGSADLLTLAVANVLLRRPADDGPRGIGEDVDVTDLPA
ncbi:MAG TPA: molybdopterin molybdotransferase MoeA [Tepidisphaeraceae bacterium]